VYATVREKQQRKKVVMQFLYSRNPWSYSIDHDIMIDFCIRTLQVDGLSVLPFDQHPAGDGSLRAVGLTASAWQAWLWQVVQQQNERNASLRQSARIDALGASKDLLARTRPVLLEPPSYPYVAWSGSDAVRERLIELWELYGTVSNQRKRQEISFSRALHKAEYKSGKRLYDELRPYHTRLPPLAIYLIAYERPLDYLLSPATLLMSRQEGQPDPEEFRARVLTAVAELVGRSGQRSKGKPAPYTRIAESSGQFNVVYRGYERKTIPPAQPRQEMPQLADPVRQMVVERLIHEQYGIVDLATIQFLREKQRTGWKLYEVSYQEIDSEKYRATFIFQQKEDGSWRFVSAGSSTDVADQWSKFFAPVRDHPLIFLSMGWIGQQILQTAHGHVIDNGFHVERVRLIDAVGQALEDSVEDGYVFLAPDLGQQLPLPMQAELYDHQGKLVWRQAVPDSGLPPWLKMR
jgi:hypothetical protein